MKKTFRKRYFAIRGKIPPAARTEKSMQIGAKLVECELWQEAKHIFTYVSFSSEVDTQLLILQALRQKKKVAVPKSYPEGKMDFYFISSLEELVETDTGILEPVGGFFRATPKKGDLILVPGIAFDRSCRRIGYGGGYYDRYLETCPATKIGLCYQEQLAPVIPAEPHDIKMDAVLTEAEWIWR